MMMLATLAFFLLVLIILGDHHITLPPVRSPADPTLRITHTISVSYLAYAPIILQPALLSFPFSSISQMLSIKYGETNKVVNMLGIWKEMRQYPGHYWPVSGIASYITTPLTVCSRSKRYLVRLLKKTQRTRVSPEQLLQEHDEDESISPRRCRHYMTMAAYIVGICVGLLNLLAGFMGLGGSGPAIMLAVTVIHNLVEGRNTGHVAAFGL
ncbi:Os12g0625966 [Oryza sativa Japonica Group]|uniref:Os12g0625966 protein n=1 Tax=Oryza sativa subsp. japonica TaxID=39947 RepID=A0A0P0YCN2_ORYSJ|nr:Os12g0625966 [Oryza sativa Japonica Group]